MTRTTTTAQALDDAKALWGKSAKVEHIEGDTYRVIRRGKAPFRITWTGHSWTESKDN